jgi:hypothetical protein
MPNMRAYRARTWFLAASIALMTGCTAVPPTAMSAQQISQDQGQQDQNLLNLSAQQQQKLAATFKALEPTETLRQIGKQIQKLLMADNIDLTALTLALESSRQTLIGNVDKIISVFRDLRETLDDNQRDKLIALLQQADNQQAQQQQPQFPNELKLSPDQQAALAALQPARSRLNQAMIDYLSNANDIALRASVTQDLAALPKPDVVAKALASLTKEQRQKMFGQD